MGLAVDRRDWSDSNRAIWGLGRNGRAQQCLAQGLLAAGLLFFMPAALAWSENWPQWRGDKFDGVSHETGLPTTWSKTEGVAWRLPLPGAAGSTPVIWEDRIFLTSAEGDNLVLLAANTDGKELWKQQLAGNNQTVRMDEGNYASPSPATDGKHVWAFMGTGDLACFTVAGEKVWQYNVQDKYGAFNIQFGMTSTPALDNGRLYLQLIHSGGATVAAIDAVTGNEIWHQKRITDAQAECEQSYASPVLYRDSERAFLLTHGGDYIVAHDLSNGEELFRCGGLNSPGNYNPTLRLVASPVSVPGVIIVPSAKNGPILALDPKAHGDITSTNEWHLWTRDHNTPDVPSPLIYDHLAYLCREDGTLLCLELETGKQIYQKRCHSDRHRASPVYADGKLYLTARDGTVTVVKAGRDFEILAQNIMDEAISSSPAISGGRIYLRSFDALYAIGK